MTRSDPGSIWSRPDRGSRGPQPAFDRGQLATAGIAIADRDGVGAVTMRAVADDLGSKPASLYRYVQTRDELLELMIDQVNGEISLRRPHRIWQRNLVLLARHSRDCYLRHPWLLDVVVSPSTIGPRTTDYLEHTLSVVEKVQLRPARKLEAIAIFSAVIASLVRNEVSQRDLPEGGAHPVHSHRPTRSGEHPLLATALADAGVGPPETASQRFDRVITTVIDGLFAESP